MVLLKAMARGWSNMPGFDMINWTGVVRGVGSGIIDETMGTSLGPTYQGDVVPAYAFLNESAINSSIAARLNQAGFSSVNDKITGDDMDYYSVLAAEERVALTNAINNTGAPALAQTPKYHFPGEGPTNESIRVHYRDYERYDWQHALNNNPNQNKEAAYDTLCTRMMWDYTGAGGGGGTGESYMQADFRSSPFQLPDIDIQRFRLEPVMRAGFLPARRPGKAGGIREHPSRYSTMRVMGIGGDAVFATTNFMLTNVREESSENFSVDPSLWGLSIRFDIEKYSIYTLSIDLINAQNFDWLRQFKYAWKNYLRGSVLAGNQWRFYILSGARLLGGYPVKYQMLSSAKDEPSIQMSMIMIITDDEALPKMQEIVDKRSGLTFFKWSGSVYSSPNLADEKVAVIEPVEKSQDLITSDEDETVFPPEMTVM